MAVELSRLNSVCSSPKILIDEAIAANDNARMDNEA